jgi:hypothetical protein
MKRALSTVILGSLVAIALASPASAQFVFDNDQAAIALHIGDVTSKNVCSPSVTAATMRVDAPLSGPSGPFYYSYLLVCNGSDSTGIQGMECGIDYQGGFAPAGGAFPISVFSWTLCGNLEFPFTGWPAPGGSNLITWTDANCNIEQSEPGVPRTVIAIGGYFYMGAYGPSTMSVIPRPASGRAKVADCSAREDDITTLFPSHLGVAGFGAPGTGYNPCGAPTPTRATTWGGVKSLFND